MKYFTKIVPLVLLLFCMSITKSFAQPTLNWQTTLDYKCLSMTQDGAGNIFFLSRAGNLSKVDQSGNVLWQIQAINQFQSGVYNVKDYAYRKQIATDKSGNVVVVTTSLDNNFHFYWVTTKFSKDGNLLWTKSYNSNTSDIAHTVVIDQNDNIIVAGGTTKNGLNRDFLVIKYDSNGNQLWLSTYNSGGGDQVWDLSVDNSDNIYVVGSGGLSSVIALLAKFNSSGALLWTSTFKPNNWDLSTGSEVKVDKNDNVFVTGFAKDQSGGYYSYFLAKYNNQGSLIHSNNWGNYPMPLTNTFSHLELDIKGNAYVAGVVSKVANQNWDIGLWKFDPAGNKVLDLSYSHWDFDIPYGIAVDNYENVYITGTSNQISPIEWSCTTLKFSKDGSLAWSESYVSQDDTPTQIIKNGHKLFISGGVSLPNYQIKGLLLNYSEPSSFTLYSSNDHGTKGSEILVPVKTIDFTNILSNQFSVNWDQSVMQYVAVESFGLNGMTANSFGTAQVNNGQLSYSWSEPNLNAATIANGTPLFAIRFKLIGNYGASTPVTVNGQPLAIEIIDSNFNGVDVTTNSGTITIDASMVISGMVKYANEEAVKNVTVKLTGAGSQSVTTDASGYYSFIAACGTNYSLTPTKINDPDPLNGINVQDVIALRRHILNVQPLTNPYLIIAGDVNNSGTLSTLDIVYIQALILQVNTKFPSGLQWTFVSSDYIFPDPSKPFPYPQSVTLSQVDGIVAEDFVGVKYGDVDISRDNTQTGRLAATAITLDIHQETVIQETQNLIEIPIRAKDFLDISGYQFTLNWDPEKMEYRGVTNKSITSSFGEHQTQSGKLTVLWDDSRGQSITLQDKEEIFVMQFVSKGGGYKDISITSNVTPVLAISKDLSKKDIQTTWSERGGESLFKAVSVYPNPFCSNQPLEVDFYTESSENVAVCITDELGRKIRQWQVATNKGSNKITWDGTDVNGAAQSSGIYVINLTTSTGVTKIKAVKI